MPIHIRDEQLRALGLRPRKDFINDALAIVARHWPRTFAKRGEDDLRAMIDLTIDEAEQYGIRARREVMKLVNLKLALGDDFIERFAWAKAILSDSMLTPDERVSRITDEAFAQLDPL